MGQRSTGAIEAASVGAPGALVRSMTLLQDDEPHTGAIYSDIMVAIEAAHEAGITRLVLSDQRR